MAQMSKNTEVIQQKDMQYYMHNYANFKTYKEDRSVIYAKGEKHFIYDNDGNRYLDGLAGLWCVNIGHGNKEIAQCMAEQAQKLAYYNTFGDSSTAPAAELAAKLAALAPGTLNHTFYGTGGSMANDSAIKIIHYYFNMLGKPNKKKVISRNLGYHGSTFLAHTLTGIQPTHDHFDLVKDLVHYVTAPYTYHEAGDKNEEEFCDFLVQELEDKILELGADNVACFIAEPILGAGGVIVPPEGYHKRTWEVCKKYDVLYISDEVVTAFGRLGHMVTSYNKFDFEPDVLVMAKGLSSGYIPIGATMISDEIFDVISRPKSDNPYFSHGFTYGGHALACAVALKNIEIIEREKLCENVLEQSPYFWEEMKKLEDLPIVGEVRGSHYMMGIEFVADKKTKAHFDPEIDITKRIYKNCKERGLILRPIDSVCIISPPLTYDREAIERTAHIVKESVLAAMEEVEIKV